MSPVILPHEESSAWMYCEHQMASHISHQVVGSTWRKTAFKCPHYKPAGIQSTSTLRQTLTHRHDTYEDSHQHLSSAIARGVETNLERTSCLQAIGLASGGASSRLCYTAPRGVRTTGKTPRVPCCSHWPAYADPSRSLEALHWRY